MFLLFNKLSRFAIAFLPRSKCLLISWLQSPSTVILEPKKINSVTFSTFSTLLFAIKWWDQMPWSFFTCLKPAFPLSSFTIKRLFNFSLVSAIKVVSSAYLRLLIFLLAILIPTCASSSPVFLMMYSAYKLNKHVTIYSFVFFSQFWTSPFHVQF